MTSMYLALLLAPPALPFLVCMLTQSQLSPGPNPVLSSCIRRTKVQEAKCYHSWWLVPKQDRALSLLSKSAFHVGEPHTPSALSFQIFWPLSLGFYHSSHIEYFHPPAKSNQQL